MARDYAIVTPRFWTGDTGRRLRGRAHLQVVAAYLMTGPSANMIGLYYLPIPTLAHETGIPLEGALEALRRLSEEGFAHYDETQEVVWVPEMGRHQVGEALRGKDNRIAGAVREAIGYRKCRFYRDFVERYSSDWNLPAMPECLAEEPQVEAPSKPLRSQDQDQDHDQDQEEASATPSAPPAPDEEPTRPLLVLDEAEGLPVPTASAPSPYQRVVEAWFAAWERAGRGKHSPLTQAEGATVKRLLAHLRSSEEVIERIDRAFADPWFLEHGDLLTFAKQREKFARPGRVGPAPQLAVRDASPGCTAWSEAREAVRGRVRPDLWHWFSPLTGRVVDGRLVLVAPSAFHAEFMAENYSAFLTEIASIPVSFVAASQTEAA